MKWLISWEGNSESAEHPLLIILMRLRISFTLNVSLFSNSSFKCNLFVALSLPSCRFCSTRITFSTCIRYWQQCLSTQLSPTTYKENDDEVFQRNSCHVLSFVSGWNRVLRHQLLPFVSPLLNDKIRIIFARMRKVLKERVRVCLRAYETFASFMS